MLKNGLQIIKKIEDNGYSAYIVGGCTRDYYMKKNHMMLIYALMQNQKNLLKYLIMQLFLRKNMVLLLYMIKA